MKGLPGWVIKKKGAGAGRDGAFCLHTEYFINIANDFVEKFIAISLHFKRATEHGYPTRIRSVCTVRPKIDD